MAIRYILYEFVDEGYLIYETINDVAIISQFSDSASKTRSSSEYRVPYSSQAITPLLVPITNYVCTKCGYVKSIYPNV